MDDISYQKDKPKHSVIHKYNNMFSIIYPEKLKRYWKRKLYGSLPSFVFKIKDEVIEDISFYDYIEKKDLIEFFQRLETKLIEDGVAVVVIDKIFEDDKPKIFLNVEDVIIWSESRSEEKYIQTIGNVNKGTIPLIEIRTYGKLQDTITYQKDENHPYTAEELKEVDSLIDYKQTLTHNSGIIRACVFTNNIDNKNWNGRPDITPEIQQRIDFLDLLYSRIRTEVELRTTSLYKNLEVGASVGGYEEDQKIDKKAAEEEVQSMMIGDLKMIEFEASNMDDVNFEIIQNAPELKSLTDKLNEEEMNVDRLLGISDDYDGGGKTNDVEAKVDRVGDSAQMESISRSNYRQAQLSIVVKKILLILGIDNAKNIEVLVKLQITDYRKKMALLKANPQLINELPTEEKLIEVFGWDEKTAKDMVEKKEKQIHKNLGSFLASNNNNLPAGMENLKDLDFVDYERIDKKNEDALKMKQMGENSKDDKNTD